MKNKNLFKTAFFAVLLLGSVFLIIPEEQNSQKAESANLVSPQYFLLAQADIKNPSQAESAKSVSVTSKMKAEDLLGLTPSEVFNKIGAPSIIYPLRADVQWQDDVVFYYDSHLYIFFFDNRVWQIRIDNRSWENFLAIFPGMDKTSIRKILGNPYHSEDNEDIFLNPAGITRLNKGFPIRLRLIYDENSKLYDAYLYRGDF